MVILEVGIGPLGGFDLISGQALAVKLSTYNEETSLTFLPDTSALSELIEYTLRLVFMQDPTKGRERRSWFGPPPIIGPSHEVLHQLLTSNHVGGFNPVHLGGRLRGFSLLPKI
jgi:hypothetical protein